MGTTTHLMTADELFRLPDDGYRYELVQGELLTMPPPPGEKHGAAGAKIMLLLGYYVETNNLGRMYGEMGFQLEQDPDTVLAPDVAFVRKERLGVLSERYRLGAPDLVVEVISPGDRKGKVESKVSMWLELGATIVWLVDPRTRTIQVLSANGTRKTLTENDELTGDEVVPGFSVLVSRVFE